MCDLDVCRICLNTDVRGYKMGQHNLRNYYEQLTRKKVNLKDLLPQWVCYECATLLQKCHKFRQKCLHGDTILKQLTVNGDITYESILSINRQKEKLTSTIQHAERNKHVRTYNFKHYRKQKFKIELDKHEKLKDDKIKQNIDIILDGTDEQKDKEELPKVIEVNKTQIQDNLVKNESVNEEIIIIPSSVTQPGDPIKDEVSESYIDIDKQLSSIFGMSNLETNSEKPDDINAENFAIEDDNFDQDSDVNFEIDEKAPSETEDDDDACFSETLNKRKRKSTAKSKAKSVTKKKKMKSEYEKEEKVELKNTRPRKHFLNPQFWKKITLSEEEAVREFKQREFNNDYYLRAKYKCQNCFKGFSKNEMLVRHLKHWHDESCGQLECRFCRMRFRRKHQLVTHIQEHLIVHHCLRCNLHFSRLKTALFHQEHHNGIKRTCKHCGKEFNHLSTYYTHVRMSHRSAHVCVACGASFVSEHGLLQHTKFKHFDNLKQLEEEIRKRREASSKAEEADTELPSAASQTQDVSQSSAGESEEIYCGKCDIKFMSRRAYNTHFFKSDNHDDGDAFAAVNKDGVTGGPGSNIRAKIPTTCEHCDKDFPSRQAYKKHHQAEHSHIPLYIPDERDICEICGASIQLGSIQYHMKSHTGEREFACPAPQCGMRFTLKANMKRHYNVKHLGMPYPKYIRRTPGRRKKKTQEILENDFSPFVRTRTGYFL